MAEFEKYTLDYFKSNTSDTTYCDIEYVISKYPSFLSLLCFSLACGLTKMFVDLAIDFVISKINGKGV